jgi:hypothetical protein
VEKKSAKGMMTLSKVIGTIEKASRNTTKGTTRHRVKQTNSGCTVFIGGIIITTLIISLLI